MIKKSTETMAISEFKATCLAVLERVRRTGTPIVVTRRGVPIAEINPPAPEAPGGEWLGSMSGTASIVGDLVSPIASDDWEALGT
ncbi:MAG: type II toxin-antitoxin system prevent-host-death family antitoxin [Gemmatimonas sp.]